MIKQARARVQRTAWAAEQHFRLLAEAIPQIVWTATPDGEIYYFNRRWFDYTGITLEETQGWGWQSALHPDDLRIWLDCWNKALRRSEICEVEYRLKRGDGNYRWQLSRALPWKENGQIIRWFGTITDVDMIVCRDLTERKQEEAFRTGQSQVLEMIARGEPLEEVLTSLMLLIEAQADEMLCSVLLLSDDGAHVRHGAAPSLPVDYVRAVDGAPIGPKNGSCGTAMYLAKPVIVTDIFADPLWEDYRELAKASGLRACWSTPILSGSGQVLGSFAMYYRQPQSPSGSEAKLTEVATHIAGIAIEHQRAEEAVRASEKRFARIFHANPHPMSLATLDDGRIIDVNKSFLELTGYMRVDLIGRTTVELIWDDPKARDELVQRLKDQGGIRNLEARLRTGSGATRVLLLSSELVDIDGQPCILSAANDITERRRAEDQLTLLQAITMEVAAAEDLPSALKVVLRRVCESTGWVLGQAWIPSTDGLLECGLLECSPAWFTTADGLDEFRMRSESVRLPPGVGLPGRVWSSKQAAWIRDVTLDTNFPRARAAEETGLKAALGIPILSGDHVIAVIEFFLREPQDEDERLVKVITSVAEQLGMAIERKHAEDELRRTQGQLAHVSRVTTMGELAASIAHEVNQPLGAIVGNADICLDWLANEQPDLKKVAEALEDISRDGHRASEVIGRIRGLAKKQLPQKVTLDINEVAREAQALVSHEANQRGVVLQAEFGAELPVVSGDRVQLQQVLLNLLMNGMDAMATMERQRRTLTISTTHDGGNALVAVSDCGAGIEPQEAEQVFKAFHSTKSGGMGMGLAISRSIIEAHGGRLWLEPNEGPGVTFKFTLPVSVSEKAQ